MTPAPRAKLKIDVLVESGLWRQPANVRSIVRRAVAQAAAAQSTNATKLAIVLTDDSAIRQLNHLWRGIDAATNVLSFPAPAPAKQVADEPPHLGDIVLAYETIAREARVAGKPLAHHIAHLAVHGYLHLLGYDHERSKDAEAMEAAERKILRRLAIPDPYRRGSAKKPVSKRGKKSRNFAANSGLESEGV